VYHARHHPLPENIVNNFFTIVVEASSCRINRGTERPTDESGTTEGFERGTGLQTE
jgi:hypothetical protein